jgi:hypothetical protein
VAEAVWKRSRSMRGNGGGQPVAIEFIQLAHKRLNADMSGFEVFMSTARHAKRLMPRPIPLLSSF